ncbi:MAG: hypothetical protein ABWY93_16150 [Mycobacterium sp.]
MFAPLWLRVLYWSVVGVIIVVLTTTFSSRDPLVTRLPWGPLFILALGVGFGAFVTSRSGKTAEPYLAAVDTLTAEQKAAAVRAAHGGPVPAEPAVWAGAQRLGELYLKQSAANRRRQLIVLGVLVAAVVLMLVGAIVANNRGQTVVMAIYVVVLPLSGWWSEYQLRRIETQHRILVQGATHL